MNTKNIEEASDVILRLVKNGYIEHRESMAAPSIAKMYRKHFASGGEGLVAAINVVMYEPEINEETETVVSVIFDINAHIYKGENRNALTMTFDPEWDEIAVEKFLRKLFTSGVIK